jgi:hypothetical protein
MTGAVKRCGKLCARGACVRCDAIREYATRGERATTLDDRDAYRHKYWGPKNASGRTVRGAQAGLLPEED